MRVKSSGEAERTLIGGQVVTGNPAGLAVAEVLKRRTPRERSALAGTGDHSRPLRYPDARDWGTSLWARPLIDIATDAMERSTDALLQKVLLDGHHFRSQPEPAGMSDSLDDASPAHLAAIRRAAESAIQIQSAELDRSVELLGA